MRHAKSRVLKGVRAVRSGPDVTQWGVARDSSDRVHGRRRDRAAPIPRSVQEPREDGQTRGQCNRRRGHRATRRAAAAAATANRRGTALRRTQVGAGTRTVGCAILRTVFLFLFLSFCPGPRESVFFLRVDPMARPFLGNVHRWTYSFVFDVVEFTRGGRK